MGNSLARYAGLALLAAVAAGLLVTGGPAVVGLFLFAAALALVVGAIGQLGREGHPAPVSEPRRSTTALPVAGLVALSCSMMGARSAVPTYWYAALAGALGAAVATVANNRIGARKSRASRVADLHPPGSGGSGAFSGPGAAAAAVVALITAWTAYGLDVVGAGDAGLVALASLLGMLSAAWSHRAPLGGSQRKGAVADLIGCLTGAGLSAGLVAWLP